MRLWRSPHVSRPTVVLLDVTMPRLSGLEALPGLRDCVSSAAIIVLTSHESPTYRQEAHSQGRNSRPNSSAFCKAVRHLLVKPRPASSNSPPASFTPADLPTPFPRSAPL